MPFVEKVIGYAPEAYRHLRGYLCVHKPAGMTFKWLKNSLHVQLCEGLNRLDQRPQMIDVDIKGSFKEDKFEVISHPSYSDSPLVTGPHFQPQDINIKTVCPTAMTASGVTLLAISVKRQDLELLKAINMIRTYHVDCVLGVATDTGTTDGKVTDRSKYRHVTPALIEKLFGSIQASFQSRAFEYAGVRPDSEEAYKLLCRGLVRPEGVDSPALVYSLRCIKLDPPNFTIEMQVINESEEFLCELVHRIGEKLRATAAAERFRIVRVGPFTADMALLQRNWRLEQILNNIQECNRKVDELRYSGVLGKPTPGESTLNVIREM